MGRGATQAAQTQVGLNNSLAQGQLAKSNQLRDTLVPQLTKQATDPSGYAPEDLSAMDTASQQSIGGSTSGAVGEGNLEAARTRNAGGFAPALDESVRSGERQLSQNAVGIEGQNANVKLQQQHDAMSQLEDMYGKNLSATLSAMGLQPGTLGAWNSADNATTGAWQPIVNTMISGASQMGAAKLGAG